ncbi:hypothetical protein JZ751_011442 [Albula glossodonta]|uniref:Uncharacterized protein n=1 Tax=Albula glossodonta TaxID=121402 RepID=A0A8T2MZD2_9TELE|nr:hypothetical protein JZ751_011442 [Albula glossodonta]
MCIYGDSSRKPGALASTLTKGTVCGGRSGQLGPNMTSDSKHAPSYGSHVSSVSVFTSCCHITTLLYRCRPHPHTLALHEPVHTRVRKGSFPRRPLVFRYTDERRQYSL